MLGAEDGGVKQAGRVDSGDRDDRRCRGRVGRLSPQCLLAPPVASISSLPSMPLWVVLVSIMSKILVW